MNYPRMTNDPHADADAVDKYHEDRKGLYKYKRCRKCKCRIEDGEEYFDIPDDFGGSIIICENCINDFSKIAFYQIEI